MWLWNILKSRPPNAIALFVAIWLAGFLFLYAARYGYFLEATFPRDHSVKPFFLLAVPFALASLCTLAASKCISYFFGGALVFVTTVLSVSAMAGPKQDAGDSLFIVLVCSWICDVPLVLDAIVTAFLDVKTKRDSPDERDVNTGTANHTIDSDARKSSTVGRKSAAPSAE
jgi:hypothetical protein